MRDAAYATFINTFRCQPEDQDAVVAFNIDIVDQVARQFPGFISATVDRSNRRHTGVNYLRWDRPSTSRDATLTEFAQAPSGLPVLSSSTHIKSKSHTCRGRLTSARQVRQPPHQRRPNHRSIGARVRQ